MNSIEYLQMLLNNRKNKLLSSKSFAEQEGNFQSIIEIEKELEDIENSLKKLEN